MCVCRIFFDLSYKFNFFPALSGPAFSTLVHRFPFLRFLALQYWSLISCPAFSVDPIQKWIYICRSYCKNKSGSFFMTRGVL